MKPAENQLAKPSAKRRIHLFAKRAVDIFVSTLGLLFLGPILLIVSGLIMLIMGRPILFRQQRPGLGGKPFTVIKFRTMSVGDGADAARLTQLGRTLRGTSIDELPELWNVLKGEMSLVGPRPLLMEYLPLYSAEQSRRHDMRPGITGLAQVSGRNLVTWPDRFALDVKYVDEFTLWLDLKVIAKTLLSVLRKEGISADGHVSMPRFTGTESKGHPSPVSGQGVDIGSEGDAGQNQRPSQS